eukprot:726803-Rhodomonas_salina.2
MLGQELPDCTSQLSNAAQQLRIEVEFSICCSAEYGPERACCAIQVQIAETSKGDKYVLRIYNNGGNGANPPPSCKLACTSFSTPENDNGLCWWAVERVKYEHAILNTLAKKEMSFQTPRYMPESVSYMPERSYLDILITQSPVMFWSIRADPHFFSIQRQNW